VQNGVIGSSSQLYDELLLIFQNALLYNHGDVAMENIARGTLRCTACAHESLS
jgi:hypothetical protein